MCPAITGVNHGKYRCQIILMVPFAVLEMIDAEAVDRGLSRTAVLLERWKPVSWRVNRGVLQARARKAAAAAAALKPAMPTQLDIAPADGSAPAREPTATARDALPAGLDLASEPVVPAASEQQQQQRSAGEEERKRMCPACRRVLERWGQLWRCTGCETRWALEE